VRVSVDFSRPFSLAGRSAISRLPVVEPEAHRRMPTQLVGTGGVYTCRDWTRLRGRSSGRCVVSMKDHGLRRFGAALYPDETYSPGNRLTGNCPSFCCHCWHAALEDKQYFWSVV
jgi:hypothetical protein